MEESNETLCVGIDLGTSRSSISASNGERHVIDSYVGWPVDMVARKIVKKSVMVGREALDNRTMLDLRRPLERGIMKEGSEKDQEAVQEILRHLINVAGIKQKGKGKSKVRAVVGVPAEAFRVSRQNLRNTMEGIADSVMLVSEPFAVAYGLEALLHALVIDIGAGTADFCVMQGRYPTEEDQRTVPNAGDSIDEQLEKLIRERHPEAQFSIHMIRQWKERWSFVGEPRDRVVVSAPVKGKATEIDITHEMRMACESILPPICETMLDLLSKV
ncbi:MAG: rod shape-determining protein, partial [Candidatus Binatia bacterium]